VSAAKPDSAPRKWWQLTQLANHYPPLHGLRVIAVISVVQVHLSFLFGFAKLEMNPFAHQISQQIWFGMDCFFILSGFLIGSLLIRDGGTLSPRKLRRFYARRSFRIFPQYYVTLTLLLFIVPVSATQWQRLPFEYLYLTNYVSWHHEPVMPWAWSLAVEEHFYLVVPFLLAMLTFIRGNRGRFTLLFALWLLGFAARLFAWKVQGIEGEDVVRTVYVWTHTKMDILIAGIFIAYLQRYHADRMRAIYEHRWVRIVAVVFVVACVAFLTFSPQRLLSPELYALFGYGTITSLMYIVLITWLLNHDGAFARFLGRPFFLRLATLGYGIYLVHLPVLAFFALPFAASLLRAGVPMAATWWLALAFGMTLAAGFAYVLHLIVDKPALLLRDRFAP